MNFSVIVPAYNVARYIDECVLSAAGQEFAGAHEVVVVDDGSSDGTRDRLAALAERDSRISVLRQEHDGAPGKARNRGIAAARGDYLVFLDSDDRLPRGALAHYQDIIVEHRPCVLAGARGVIDEDSRKVGERQLPRSCMGLQRLEGRLRLGRKQLFQNASGKAFARALVESKAIRFTEGHPGQDTAFSLLFFAHAASFHGSDAPVYDVRVRGDVANPSLTQQFDPRSIERRLISARQCVAELRARGNETYAADAAAYLLLGIVSRVMQQRRRGPIERLDRIYRPIAEFRAETAASDAPRRMSGELRRLWRLASCMLVSPAAFRASLWAIRACGVR